MKNPVGNSGNLCPGHFNLAEYAANFKDIHPPLTSPQALIESERCYFCFDAPCQSACPTGIDVPSFIYRIVQGNMRGAARAILEANILGGTCARVCPVETLCEKACVRNTNEDKPVEIAALQRHATDSYFSDAGRPLFRRQASTGKRVAVVGAGPAGLACAHGLSCRGHDIVLFEAQSKLGGLNEYGLATYKMVDDFAQKEIAWLLSIGGIEARCSQMLGRDITLDGLLQVYDAVFLGMGLAGVNALGIMEPQAIGLRNAVEFIAELRQTIDKSTVVVGRRVVVIGGGMTAVDASVQARKLGAEEVNLVYRRGPESMSSSTVEQRWAQTNGVTIRHCWTPMEILCEAGHVSGVRFAATGIRDGKLVLTGDILTLAADMVLKAIGQTYVQEPAGASIRLQGGRIVTDEEGHSSLERVWAGGDCQYGGQDLTVVAVEHGKRAAISIDASLRALNEHTSTREDHHG